MYVLALLADTNAKRQPDPLLERVFMGILGGMVGFSAFGSAVVLAPPYCVLWVVRAVLRKLMGIA